MTTPHAFSGEGNYCVSCGCPRNDDVHARAHLLLPTDQGPTMTQLPPDHEIAGLRLSDLFRDTTGLIWEIISLTDQPTVELRRIDHDDDDCCSTARYVIRSPIFEQTFPDGPLRPGPNTISFPAPVLPRPALPALRQRLLEIIVTGGHSGPPGARTISTDDLQRWVDIIDGQDLTP